MGDKPLLKRDFIAIDPRVWINHILGTDAHANCDPLLSNKNKPRLTEKTEGAEDPCLYYQNKLIELGEADEGSVAVGETIYGLASFYKPELHGECTSVQDHYDPKTKKSVCKKFDQYDHFVASNIYAPGTVLKIKDLMTWNSTFVVVGDYGPNTRFGKKNAVENRVVDFPASLFLGIHGSLDGMTPVSVQVVTGVDISVLTAQPECIVPEVKKEEWSDKLPKWGNPLYSFLDGVATLFPLFDVFLPRPREIKIGTTNKLDALEALYDLAEKYPEHVYLKESAKVFKRGSEVWWNDPKRPHWARIKKNMERKYYEVVLILGPGEYELYKTAKSYTKSKGNWGKKNLAVSYE